MIPWCPIPKAVLREILRDAPRPLPEEIAYLSVSLDCNDGTPVSVTGYASLWGWSQGRVRRFLERIEAKVQYPEDTGRLQNQRGVIVTQMPERPRSDSGGMRLLDFNILRPEAEGYRSDTGVIAERSRVTTINNNNNPKKESIEEDAKAPSGPPSCPIKQIVHLWIETCPHLSAPDAEGKVLRSQLQSRWRERKERQTIDWWKLYFERIAKSDFLSGREKDFTANLLWVTGPKNMEKILNGQYDGNRNARSTAAFGGKTTIPRSHAEAVNNAKHRVEYQKISDWAD